MAISKKNIIEMSWKSITTETGRTIFNALYGKDMTQNDLQELIGKSINKRFEQKMKEKAKKENWSEEKLKSEINKGRKGRREYRDEELHNASIINLVSNYINAFLDLGYIFENGKRKISKFHNKPLYFANIKPFFDYAKSILPIDKQFTPEEESFFIIHTANPDEMRAINKYQGDNIIEKMKRFLLEYLLLSIASDGSTDVKEEDESFFMSHDPQVTLIGNHFLLTSSIREKIRLILGLDSTGKKMFDYLLIPEEDKKELMEIYLAKEVIFKKD